MNQQGRSESSQVNGSDFRALLDRFPTSSAGAPIRPFEFVERLGMELLLSERGRAVIRLPLEHNSNHVGTMYAGALFTLAEVPGGQIFVSAFDSSRYFPVVGEMNLRFMSPATSSVLVDARMSDTEMDRVSSELELRGRSRWVLEQELVDEGGTVVAVSKATYFGLSHSALVPQTDPDES